MNIDITKRTTDIIAIHKVTGEIKKVNILHVGERRFNSAEDSWGIWHNYSKRGNWNLSLTDEK